MGKSFLDTNALLEYGDNLKNIGKFYISSVSLLELENIKTSVNKDEVVKYKARQVARFLDTYRDSYEVIVASNGHYQILESNGLPITNDNLIVACAKSINADKFISGDLLCKTIAKEIFGLKVDNVKINKQPIYTGYLEVTMDDYDMATFYQCMVNKWDLNINEYLLIKNTDGEIVDKLRWTENGFVPLKYKPINSKQMGKIKPVNVQQELLFDILQNDTRIKATMGRFGTGKDYCMLAHCMSWLENGKYQRLIWIRNVVEVKNSGSIGFLPGTATEKLMPYASPLYDHIGGQYGLEMLIKEEKIELQHLSTIRGRDFKNCILYCSEAENLTKEQMQLIIGRVGEGSVLLVNGDIKQVDKEVFRNNNGLTSLISNLKGNKYFGFVQLEKTERSEVAALADLLDE